MALILVIDDEPQMRQTFRRILESHGHRVVDAKEGRDGIKLFKEEKPDLVITDLIMPGVEGIETIREIKRPTPDAKIIAMTGSASSENPGLLLRAAHGLGASIMLHKPVSMAGLMDAVNDLLKA